jgi:adenine-specific DNA-methyltransferase
MIETTTITTNLADASPEERNVLDVFARSATYRAAADTLGKSHGYVHRIVEKFGQLKNHEVRNSRARARQQAQERAATEFLAQHLETTIENDALALLRALPGESVQLFVSSPPYNIGKDYEGSEDAMSHVAYLAWQVSIIAEMTRALKPGGTIVYQVGTTWNQDGERIPIDTLLDQYFRMAKLSYQSRIVWPGYGAAEPKTYLKPSYETALVFSKGLPIFNPNAIREPQLHPDKRHFKGKHKGQLSGNALGGFPTDTWRINRIGHNNCEQTSHPAQFPIEFPMRAILAYSLPGDVVCDMFSGSGSTQIAAARAGRSFIGSDLGYAELRAERLASLVVDTVTNLRGVTEESLRVRRDDAKRRNVKLGILEIPGLCSKAEDLALCLDLGLHD